jgi:hypothetical protein
MEARATDLATEDGELMAKYQDLDVLGIFATEVEDDQFECAANRTMQKAKGHRSGSLVGRTGRGQPGRLCQFSHLTSIPAPTGPFRPESVEMP